MGWRAVFWIMSLLSLVLIVRMLWKLPDYPGQAADKRLPLLIQFSIDFHSICAKIDYNH
jgi:predicted MFS family arabinose efflux permease